VSEIFFDVPFLGSRNTARRIRIGHNGYFSWGIGSAGTC
jgi:hypothetical protein